MENSKPLLNSKTLWFNVLTLCLAIVSLPEFVSLLPVSALPYIANLNAVGNILLRTVTSKPVTLGGRKFVK